MKGLNLLVNILGIVIIVLIIMAALYANDKLGGNASYLTDPNANPTNFIQLLLFRFTH